MKIIKTIFCTLLLIPPFKVLSYDNNFTHQWWANFGLGVGKIFENGDFSGSAGQFSFNGMITPKLFITFETTATRENAQADASTTDSGILLGYKSKHPCWYGSLAAGIAYYKIEKKYRNWSWGSSFVNELAITRVGFPLEGQLFWTPVRHFGIGLIGHCVINEYPSAVGLIAIQIS